MDKALSDQIENVVRARQIATPRQASRQTEWPLPAEPMLSFFFFVTLVKY